MSGKKNRAPQGPVVTLSGSELDHVEGHIRIHIRIVIDLVQTETEQAQELLLVAGVVGDSAPARKSAGGGMVTGPRDAPVDTDPESAPF